MKKEGVKEIKMEKEVVYVLVDSHALVHRAYHAMPFLQNKQGVPSGALFGLANMLLGAIEKFHPTYIFAANDLPKTTFREMAFKDYKAHRSKTEDALIEQIESMPRLFDAFGIPLVSLEGYEADDVIGTFVKKIQKDCEKKKTKYKIIILTGDMDIMQLVDEDKVVVYTAKKGEEDLIFNEVEVFKKHGLKPEQIPDYKGLRGDTSDNIPGIKGIGEKTALTILQAGDNLEYVYKMIHDGKDRDFFGISERMYELLKNGEEDSEFSKELATINCDIEVDVPKTEIFDLKLQADKIKDICEEYNFLSIRKKMEKLQGMSAGRDESGEVVLNDFAKVEEGGEVESLGGTEAVRGEADLFSSGINFSETNFKKVQIALWLLNSAETNIDQIRANYILNNISKTNNLSFADETKVLKFLEKELANKKLLDIYNDMEVPLIEILNESNKVGIKVDREKLQKLLKTYEKEKEILVSKIYELAGHELNLNSPKQLGVVLFEEMKIQDMGAAKMKKTKGGKVSTNAAVLEEMKENHEIVEKILNYRETEKMINTYLEPLLMHSTFDGRIHTTFIQTGAATGRFASTNPNMQNIPVKGPEGTELRKCFVASQGKILLAADYSQIELRCAGILSGDPYLVETYKKGADIHTMIASKMFNKKSEDITKDERNAAKAMNFGIFYGMGVSSIKNTLKVERNVAQAFYDSYTIAMSTLMKYLKDTISKTKDIGYTETLYGRQRQVPELFSNIPMIRASGERIAMNAPIQGTSADIIKFAMVDFYKACKEKGWAVEQVAFLLQIHDEILFEVDEDLKEDVENELKKVMENVISLHHPKIEFTNIPIIANVKSGPNWGEM